MVNWLTPVLFLFILFWGLTSVQAFTAGETYDASNIQEIEEMLPEPPLKEWVIKDGWILKTGKLEDEFKFSEGFLQASKDNDGKYDIGEKGLLVLKNTGEIPDFVYGFPFPEIDPADPKAGEKIMENNTYSRYQTTAQSANARVVWIGENGPERDIVACGDYLYYNCRRNGKVDNSNTFLQQMMTYVGEPFELRGTVQMSWTYNSPKPDAAWAYVPMLRRVRRVSAAVRSDPFLGSDFCTDDTNAWAGKNMDVTWKYVGQKTLLLPFPTEKTQVVKQNSDGSIETEYIPVKIGHEDPAFKGAPWAPLSLVWVPRPVWLVEGMPKDPYYNYGRQIFIMDRDTNLCFYKVVYDRSGEYWKTVLVSWPNRMTSDGLIRLCGDATFYMVVDSKTHHATVAHNCIEYPGRRNASNIPVTEMSERNFTDAYIRQLSK